MEQRLYIHGLCINCKYYDPPEWANRPPNLCYAMAGQQSPVTGENLSAGSSIAADLMRMTLCGWENPKFWEPKS